MSEVKVAEWLRMSEWNAIYLGEDGQFWHVIEPPGDWAPGRVGLGLACQSLCGHRLRRIHLTCVTCRIRRVMRGEMPRAFPVGVYMLTWVKGRRFERIKAFLLKRVLSVAEFLAN